MTDGILKIIGLRFVKSGELVLIRVKQPTLSGSFKWVELRCMVLNLERFAIKAVVLGNDSLVSQGNRCFRSWEIVSISTGWHYTGSVVDALGFFIDGHTNRSRFSRDSITTPVEVKAPGIIPRKSVSEPLQTGILAVDSMIPVGRGQRELIIGDRQTGKTAIAVDTIINQERNRR